MQHAIGEDVPALQIRRDLDFVDGEKRHVEIARHRLHGRDPEPRVFRLDLFLAGDQRDAIGAGAIDDLVVDLARQEPQRQADHATGMRQHPLDGEVGLAGVGRPQHRGDTGAGSPFVCERGGGESHDVRGFLDFAVGANGGVAQVRCVSQCDACATAA